MTPVYQTTFGDKGNCFSAACASLFDDPIEDWECVANWRPDWREQLQAKLSLKGLHHIEVNMADESDLPVRGVALCDGQHYLLGVISKNELNHVVIGRYSHEASKNGLVMFSIAHDPLGPCVDNTIVSIQAMILFVKSF